MPYMIKVVQFWAHYTTLEFIDQITLMKYELSILPEIVELQLVSLITRIL
jgi:hypothetical protein